MAGTSNSQSTSSSFIPGYAEEPFLQSIAAYAGQVGSNVYNWAQGEYAKNSALTDANIHNYLNTSASALQQANNYSNEYNGPVMQQVGSLINDANSYASPSRMALDMGAAESGQMQAADASRQNAERDLQSYGIDPSSGRYAALDRASQVSAGAAAAGAAQQARQNDIATGQNLRQQAIQFGETLPGATINAMNTGLQGFAGAENAGLANANTGVALQGAANPFLTTASSLKYPPLGQQSQSTANSISTDPAGSGGGSKSPSSGGGSPSGGSGGGGLQPGQSSGIVGSNSGNNQISAGPPEGGGGGDNGGFGDPGSFSLGGDPNTGSGSSSNFGDPGGSFFDPYGATGSLGDNTGSGSSSNFGDPGGATFDPYSATGSTGDSTGGMSVSDFGAGNYDYGSGGDFAAGGAIDDGDEAGAIPDDGGTVPQSASPSGGQMVDDVQAQSPKGPINVNTDEFVIPRDVALWKGQEFFQKLIMQSRQARIMAPAKPSRGPPQQAMR